MGIERMTTHTPEPESFADMIERLKGTTIYGVYDEAGDLLAWTWDFETAARLSSGRVATAGPCEPKEKEADGV